MANSDKEILITPNRGQSALPEVKYVGSGNDPITSKVLDDNTISFESGTNQLFTIGTNVTSGNIFTVSDVSGVPSIAVNANGRVDLARYKGSVNVGYNVNTTDKTLAVTGKMHITNPIGNSDRAEIHFGEEGTVTGTGSMYLGYDGPNKGDNENYWFVRNQSNTDVLTATYGGAVGIRTVNPRTMLHLTGGHTTTQFRMTLPSGSNGNNTGEVNMQMWVSEGNVSWENGGIGMNVSNYNTVTFPTASNSSDNGWFPRLNSGLGAAYIRFITAGGYMSFSTVNNDGTAYRDQIHMRYGCLGVNVVPSGTYRIQVQGDVNVTGKYYVNGQEASGLPTQDNKTRGSYLVSDGSNGAFWQYPGQTAQSTGVDSWRYRSLITHGYISGGYKGSQPWRSMNKTWHNNDTTMYTGEQVDRAAAYCDGTWSDFNGYIHGTVNSYAGNSSHTSSYNLHTGICRNQGDGRFSQYSYGYEGDNPRTVMGYNVTGGWQMNAGRNDCGCATAQKEQAGYITGGGSSTTNKLHFATEIMYNTSNSGDSGDFVAGCGMESRSYFSWRNSSQKYIQHSNDSWSNQGFAGNNRGWCKALPTKWGHFYIGTDDNVTTPLRKVKGSDGSAISNYNRSRAAGEENMEMGQDWGYKLGDFNGQQNNHTEKWDYSTDSITTMGFACRPKGHYGQSSAACSSAAGAVTVTRNT